MADEPEYHEGLPMLPPARAREVADRLRIQVIGVRAGWSAWAARECTIGIDRAAADERWRELMAVDRALRGAETQLEVAIAAIAKEDVP